MGERLARVDGKRRQTAGTGGGGALCGQAPCAGRRPAQVGRGSTRAGGWCDWVAG